MEAKVVPFTSTSHIFQSKRPDGSILSPSFLNSNSLTRHVRASYWTTVNMVCLPSCRSVSVVRGKYRAKVALHLDTTRYEYGQASVSPRRPTEWDDWRV